MTKKLIALDTDGTLLDPNGKILESSKKVIKKLSIMELKSFCVLDARLTV